MRGLRAAGVSCEADFSDRKLKARFKLADDANACYTVVVGDDEVANREMSVKDAKTGDSTVVEVDELVKFMEGSE